eukprot:2570137-Pleurochrysis_carterae.AAC.1
MLKWARVRRRSPRRVDASTRSHRLRVYLSRGLFFQNSLLGRVSVSRSRQSGTIAQPCEKHSWLSSLRPQLTYC